MKSGAFRRCSGLTTVTLGNGLEKIGMYAFEECTSLVRIVIPPAVKTIYDSAFNGCSSLTNVKFFDEIEKFVCCEAMWGWWNQGVHEKSLSTYCFLVRCSIPARFSGLALVSSWQANIHDMLRRIPTVSAEVLNVYFDTIESKLTAYENLLNEAPTLIPEQFGLDDGIFLNVLSFL
jgi:hypothetical protein